VKVLALQGFSDPSAREKWISRKRFQGEFLAFLYLQTPFIAVLGETLTIALSLPARMSTQGVEAGVASSA
jgi:hypothetical protein